MDRRHFSKLSFLSLASITSCSTTDEQIVNGIDSHCHIWEPGSAKDYKFETIQKVAAPAGIQRFIVVVTSAKGNENYVLKMKDKYPSKVGIITLLDPGADNLDKKMTSNRGKGILGYRLNSKDIGETWLKNTGRMWNIAADLNVSICLLRKPNASIHSMKEMIHKHQKTKVIIDHLGLIDPDNNKEVNEFLSLAVYENCYVKVSRFFDNRIERSGTEKLNKLFEKVYREFGSERLMWGSNAPVEVSNAHNYSRTVNLISNASCLNAENRKNIFVSTAEKLFF